VTVVDRDGSSSAIGTFPSVLAGLGEVGAQKLEWGDSVEIVVSPSADVEVEAIVEAMRSANPEFAPTGTKRYVVYDPPITVNGRRFFGVAFDDGSWEFVENADEYSTIAYVQLFESASRTSGYFTETVGRLPGGEVLELSEPDEDDGCARPEISAVVRSLPCRRRVATCVVVLGARVRSPVSVVRRVRPGRRSPSGDPRCDEGFRVGGLRLYLSGRARTALLTLAAAVSTSSCSQIRTTVQPAA
jgi:hypothetical protein